MVSKKIAVVDLCSSEDDRRDTRETQSRAKLKKKPSHRTREESTDCHSYTTGSSQAGRTASHEANSMAFDGLDDEDSFQMQSSWTSGEHSNSTGNPESLPQPPPIIAAPEPEPTLTPEQQHLVDIIMSGKNVFYTGSAGTGKSTVLKAFVKRLDEREKKVDIISPTGISALNVAGVTYFVYAGWNPDSSQKPLADLEHNARWQKYVHERLTETSVLVIDEISMIENHQFERLDGILKASRENDAPFGGVQLIVTGDFCQLPPVVSHALAALYLSDHVIELCAVK